MMRAEHAMPGSSSRVRQGRGVIPEKWGMCVVGCNRAIRSPSPYIFLYVRLGGGGGRAEGRRHWANEWIFG